MSMTTKWRCSKGHEWDDSNVDLPFQIRFVLGGDVQTRRLCPFCIQLPNITQTTGTVTALRDKLEEMVDSELTEFQEEVQQ